MQIRGREINFLRTVKASADISKLCPDGDLERIGELFDKVYNVVEVGAHIIHYLNEGYEMNKHFDDPSYQPNIISIEEIMYLDEVTYQELMQSAMNSFSNIETTIEIEETKKNEIKTESN